ncbi:MAG: response regulator [Lachnospiraceae bacterium]|nr:response regulator [Lachnospiraceae bacterium]
MYNEKMKMAAIRANRILSKLILVFLFFIPVILILYFTGYIQHDMDKIIYVCVAVLIFCVFPGIFNKISYNEDAIAIVVLMSLEIMLSLLGLNPYMDVAFAYIAVPVLSLFYCNQRLSQRICLLCYIVMMGVVYYRATVMSGGFYNGTAVYMSMLQFTIEYVIVASIVCYVADYFESHVLEGGKEQTSGLEYANLSGSQVKERKEAVVDETVYDVQGLFRGIEKDMHGIIRGKNKSFELDLDENLPIKLYGAREEIRQALSGICSDLLMYRSEANIRMRVTYESGIVPKRGQNITLVIRIIGYTDITAVTVNKAALGYFLSQRIIDRLKGSFEDLSDSEEAVFRICLLQRVEDERTIRAYHELQMQDLRHMKTEAINASGMSMYHSRIQVLVVDDNRENCKLIDAILSSMGVLVECVNNGAKAIELLEGREYQMVFIDQMMPEKSGIETVKELRYIDDEYYQQLPIVLMSVNARADAKKEYVALGFSDCISKPIKENEVKTAIQRWIKDDYPVTYAEYVRMQENGNE